MSASLDVRRHDTTVHYIFYDDVRRHNSSILVRGQPFDSWGRAMVFCEKKIVQQMLENK